jgi:hypothetical protein
MTVKTYILKVILIQTDLRIVAVDIIQPHTEVMDDVPRFLVTQFTDTAVDRHALIDVRLPCSEPGPALIELFLGQHSLPLHVMVLFDGRPEGT